MRKLFLWVLAITLLNGSHAMAQSLVDSALRYNKRAMKFHEAADAKLAEIVAEDPSDTSEGGEINEFLRLSKYKKQLFAGNVPDDSDALLPAVRQARRFITSPYGYCTSSAGGAWKCLGPFNNTYYGGKENQGRVNDLWIAPDDTNRILAATYGGLWKTVNGGKSWHNISDSNWLSAGVVAA